MQQRSDRAMGEALGGAVLLANVVAAVCRPRLRPSSAPVYGLVHSVTRK